MNAASVVEVADASSVPPEPLWRRAILERGRDHLGQTNCGTLARLALRGLMLRAGADVSLVTIHTWTRPMQGRAYLWALGAVNGCEELPPTFVARGSAVTPLNRGQIVARCGLGIAALEAEHERIERDLLELRKLRVEIQTQGHDPTPEQRARASRIRVPDVQGIVDLAIARRA